MFDVITFGTATLDVFLRSPGLEVDEVSGHKDICVRYGGKLEVDEIFFESGGGGTNTAVTFARHGLKVACVTQIGFDFAGEKITTDLKNEGVETGLIDRHKDIYSDYSTILWAGDGGRTVLVYRGKTKLEAENIAWDKLEAEWYYLASLEGNLEIVKRLIDRIQTTGNSKIAWNPGGRELKQKKAVLELLPGITLVNMNKEEMEELLQVQSSKLEVQSLLKLAQELPCKYIVITDDRRGAYLWDRDNQKWFHSGIYEDSPRFETTGAGDGFGSGLVTGFIKNFTLPDCLWLAAANASGVVSKVGAKKGILKTEDLTDWPKDKLLIEEINL